MNKQRLLPTLFLVACWIIFTQASVDSLLLGGLFIALAITLNIQQQKSSVSSGDHQQRFCWLGIIAFAGYFLRASLRAGWQTACIALRPKLALTPQTICYRSTLSGLSAQRWLFNVLNLMPGTLGIAITKRGLVMQVLNNDAQTHRDIAQCERYVAKLFR